MKNVPGIFEDYENAWDFFDMDKGKIMKNGKELARNLCSARAMAELFERSKG